MALRKLPAFYTDPPITHWITGVLLLMMGSLALFGVVQIEKAAFTFFDWLETSLVFIVGLFFSSGGLIVALSALSRAGEKNVWVRSAAASQTIIVYRARGEETSDEAHYYGQSGPFCYLELAMTPGQFGRKPHESTVHVDITVSQYMKYERRQSVTIYTSREDPFVFLLEDEV